MYMSDIPSLETYRRSLMRLTRSPGIVAKSRRDFDAMPLQQSIHSKYYLPRDRHSRSLFDLGDIKFYHHSYCNCDTSSTLVAGETVLLSHAHFISLH
jgi:hypothetical protein